MLLIFRNSANLEIIYIVITLFDDFSTISPSKAMNISSKI